MLKIYETFVKQPLKEFIIEELIKEAKVGRTSGFDAIKWLEEKRLIEITPTGKQKSVRLVLDETALNFKFFLDSIELKNLDSGIIFEISLLNYLVYKNVLIKYIDAILLFGSAASSKKPNDIDLLVICENTPEIREKLKGIRKLVENICECPINLHFSGEKEIYGMLQKLMVYNKSYSIGLLKDIDKSLRIKLQYIEALHDINSIINNINDNDLTGQLISRLINNLAFCNCWLKNIVNINKEEAISLFKKDYMAKIRNFDKTDNISKFDILKRITNEIGQKIFR